MSDRVTCPICNAEVSTGTRHGQFDGAAIDCPVHGQFEISADARQVLETELEHDPTTWQHALDRARQNISPSDVPMITTLEM